MLDWLAQNIAVVATIIFATLVFLTTPGFINSLGLRRPPNNSQLVSPSQFGSRRLPRTIKRPPLGTVRPRR